MLARSTPFSTRPVEVSVEESVEVRRSRRAEAPRLLVHDPRQNVPLARLTVQRSAGNTHRVRVIRSTSRTGVGPRCLQATRAAARAISVVRDSAGARRSRDQEAARSAEGTARHAERRVHDCPRGLVRERAVLAPAGRAARQRAHASAGVRPARASGDAARPGPRSDHQGAAPPRRDDEFIAAELAQMGEIRVSPTNDRSVLGVMNEFAFQGEFDYKVDRVVDLDEISLRLSRLVVGPLMSSGGSPDQELATVLGIVRSNVIPFPTQPSADSPAPGIASDIPTQGHAAGHQAADLAPPARRRRGLARRGARRDPGGVRLVELPPVRVRGRPYPLRDP